MPLQKKRSFAIVAKGWQVGSRESLDISLRNIHESKLGVLRNLKQKFEYFFTSNKRG